MVDFLLFEEQLRDFLQHLRSPGYIPPEIVCEVIGCPPAFAAGEAHLRLIESINSLKPPDESPPDLPAKRVFDLLQMRFVQGLTQEEIAERMFMSVRNLQRIQSEAIHLLALRLWQEYRERQASGDQLPGDWQSQVEKELSSLESSKPESFSDVQAVIDSVIAAKDSLFGIYGIEISTGFIQPGMTATVHPSLLRQVLIAMVARLARSTEEGKVDIYAGLDDAKVKISLQCQISPAIGRNSLDLVTGIPIPPGASIETEQRGERIFVQIWLPSTGKLVVLVVEDNEDVVHYYRRCTAGTNFQILHAPPENLTVEMIASNHPDIIVLDIMMPEIDGWQLLTHLYENPETREIPVIVSSIIREPELALALGAVCCLTKPVSHQKFVDALHFALRHPRQSRLSGLTSGASRPAGA